MAHILLQILAIHWSTDPCNDILLDAELGDDALTDLLAKLTNVVFKANRIYRHRLLQVNYTTFDLQHESKAVHLHTDHHNIMLLLHTGIGIDGSSQYPLCYVWVWKIACINVIYTGPRLRDYQSWHIKFLWVWWFEVLKDHPSGWQYSAFDTVKFVPMAEGDTFGFMDPGNVLWACHLMLSFADGLLHSDGIAVSLYICDSNNWKCYYGNQCRLYSIGSIHNWLPTISFIDHAMIMRYYWSLGIRHTYSHVLRPEISEAYPNDSIENPGLVPGLGL